MIDTTYFTLKHALDTGAREELFDSLRPTNGFESVEVFDSHLTFVHRNTRISWRLVVHSYDSILGHDQLGDELVAGGCGEYGVLQFPNDFGWAKQDEAVVFWSKVLPVKPLRILFTWIELCCVYIQLDNGMIASLKLFWDNQDMEDEAVIKTIFTKIIESNQTMESLHCTSSSITSRNMHQQQLYLTNLRHTRTPHSYLYSQIQVAATKK